MIPVSVLVGVVTNYFGQYWRIRNSHKFDEYADFYAIAEVEVHDGEQDPGLWSKALVRAAGDESQRKVVYMQLRVEQLNREAEST